jgi:hypothetical protein
MKMNPYLRFNGQCEAAFNQSERHTSLTNPQCFVKNGAQK